MKGEKRKIKTKLLDSLMTGRGIYTEDSKRRKRRKAVSKTITSPGQRIDRKEGRTGEKWKRFFKCSVVIKMREKERKRQAMQ